MPFENKKKIVVFIFSELDVYVYFYLHRLTLAAVCVCARVVWDGTLCEELRPSGFTAD